MRDKIIRIVWSDPMTFDEAIISELSNVQGLYYITRIFGEKETSLYIGKASKNNTIKNRLRSHKNSWLSWYRGKKFVRIGTIIYPPNYDEIIIDHAESAILFDPEHKDILIANIDKRQSYSYNELYRIENTGNYFELKPFIRMHEH